MDTFTTIVKVIDLNRTRFYRSAFQLKGDMSFSQNRPKSSGRVSLRSRNPLHKPIIEPNYFAHREDINVLIEGIRIAVNISNQPAMRRFGSRVHRVPFPGCRHLPFDSDEYWECSIRQVCSI